MSSLFMIISMLLILGGFYYAIYKLILKIIRELKK